MKVRPYFAMQNVQKSLKLRNIADIQALTPGRVKKITLYIQYIHTYVDIKKRQAQWAQSRKQERDQFKV